MTHTVSPLLTNRQKQVIMGTILGGSSIVRPANGKNCYLSMRGKSERWLKFKAEELSSLASWKPFTVETTNRWHSMCYPIFNDYFQMFYVEKQRKINPEVIDQLGDVAMMIWFGDCGRHERNRVILNTHIWGEEGTQKIKEYFETLGWASDIIRERGNFRIKLDAESSKDFIGLIEPHLPVWWFH
jgi:hypothetical protein